MASAPNPRSNSHGPQAAGSTHGTDLLKRVPQSRTDRENIRRRASELARCLDRSRPLARHVLESHARSILEELGLSEGYVGWTMVALASAYWQGQIESIPHDRRLLLLPHCLRDSRQCPAKYDQLGLLCENCGACDLTELRAEAEANGCKVLIAEGSPTVLEIILRGHADALLGSACLNSLEKAFDKILLAGIPCMAVPLLGNSCADTSTDLDWVREMIRTPYHAASRPSARTYIHLLRLATGMFEPGELERLVPRVRSAEFSGGDKLGGIDPIAATEALAHDFLAQGGKHFRPFITLAAYDALQGGDAAGPEGAEAIGRIADSVRRIALAIEVFHKASLVHDDIEDDDAFRYGRPTLHRKFGTSQAINVGDYLVGLGYRLVAGERGRLPGDTIADILGRLADAHTKLCEGQGAELAWRDSAKKRLTPLDALKIYALKTAPAFEAALYAGLRLAGPLGELADITDRFTRHLGVAFQVLNDLQDWQGDDRNKRASGTDVLGGRPTVLWALALERLDEPDRRQCEAAIAEAADNPQDTLARVRALYDRAGVFDQARDLIRKHRDRAHTVAATASPPPLRDLLHYLADTILSG